MQHFNYNVFLITCGCIVGTQNTPNDRRCFLLASPSRMLEWLYYKRRTCRCFQTIWNKLNILVNFFIAFLLTFNVSNNRFLLGLKSILWRPAAKIARFSGTFEKWGVNNVRNSVNCAWYEHWASCSHEINTFQVKIRLM